MEMFYRVFLKPTIGDATMNPGIIIGIIALAIIIVAIVIVAVRKRGAPSRKPEEEPALSPDKRKGEVAKLEEKKPEPQPPKVSPEKNVAADAVAAKKALEHPSAEDAAEQPAQREALTTDPAPGVTLDESAEEEAAARLKDARHERRIKRLRQGLAPTRGGLIAKIGTLFKEKKEIDPSLLEELEDTLITSDVGAATASWMITILKNALEKDELKNPGAVWDLLKEEVREALCVESAPLDVKTAKPYTIMVVGVNGVGKTTTIGKLATQFSDEGLKVVLAAGDTFRAAAVNQLEIWGRRAGAEVVKGKEGADPSSVVFEAVKRAEEIGADVVIADTAGRLHTKAPLMEELKKINRVMGKAKDGAPHQVLMVLDSTVGQNAIQQVAMFKEALELSGLVLTKLDGTAKGGVIIGICHEHKIPVRYIGIGEAKDDLRDFDIGDFVDALFMKEDGQ